MLMNWPSRNPSPRIAVLGAAVALLAGACADGPAEPELGGPNAEEAAWLADQIDAMTGGILGSQIALAGSIEPAAAAAPAGMEATSSMTIEFEGSRSCPVSGEVRLEGVMQRERDDATMTLTVHTEATRTMDSCTRQGPRGLVTVDGELTITADRKWVDGRPSGPQTMTHVGSITWTRESGESRTCEIDLTSVRDPEAHSRSLTGSVCGREISRTVTWSHD